ncbi:RIMS-binding protein 2 isoform X3 [Photinus pyralis]|uniref:RIMS-binding protein 2 isoform X3 n=1 Tax=Photinus pyralis TaxID=7054 RepID=UPI0012673D10|nr:RIMS-binding protein 2 isoform X3 [Photinus pyralis]
MDLEMQLRAAEARKTELERAHAEAMAALRNCGSDLLEARQSRVRELEKKVALETVRESSDCWGLLMGESSACKTLEDARSRSYYEYRPIFRCEELQLELAASQRGRVQISNQASQSWNTTSKGSEIERIMAKIEQDNRILAELDHSRSTTLGAGIQTSASSHALGESSPPISPITMSHTTPSIYPTSTLCGPTSNCPHQSPASLGYLPSSSTYNPIPISQQFNSLTNPYTSKPNPMGTAFQPIAHHQHLGGLGQIGLGQTPLVPSVLGQTSTMGQTGLGPTSAILGNPTILPPPSTYTTSTISNPTFTHLVSNNPTSLPQTAFSNPSYSNQVASALPQYTLPYNPITTTSFTNNVTFSNPLSSQFNNMALSGPSAMSIKLKPFEEVELGAGRRAATPVTPHPPAWSLGSSLGMTDTRPLSRMMPDGLDSDWGGMHSTDRSYLNGHSTEGQVDMLDIPGKGRCSVYIARFSYDPEPEAEEELAVQAGDYLLVWGEPVGTAGYLDAETLDGRRGLVPSHFAQRLIGDDLLEFHQAVLTTLREEEISAETFAADIQRLNEIAEMSEGQEDDNNDGDAASLFGNKVVLLSTLKTTIIPAPRNLTLERQLNKSVLIGWTAPDVGPGNQIESYHVYVDGVLKTTIKATERTRALVEGVDSNRPHRISVRSVTANRRTSRDAACTMIIGRDTHQLGPSAVRATNVTATSSVINWLPANSNHQHVVCVNNVEVRTVKPGIYRHTITGLTPNTQYRVTVRAKHHRASQNVANLTEDLPMPAAAHTDFRTLPKGLPDPPSEIMVEPGPQDGTLLVTWHPVQPPHHPGSIVTGYSVYADGKKVTDVDSPTGDHALIDISKLLGLNPRHVTVKTKARDSQSVDSVPTPIPVSVLRGGAVRARQQPHSAVPMHMRQQQQQRQPQGQQIIEHDENLSDKEIFPTTGVHQQQSGIPSIEITKESFETNLSEDELQDRRNPRQQYMQQQRQHRTPPQQRNEQTQQPYYQQAQPNPRNVTNMRTVQQRQVPPSQQQAQQPRGAPGVAQPTTTTPTAQKRARWFVALFDYDPATMSPNPDACEEELPFSEGDSIKVWGDKDADGFYWGECRGRRGYVPHNMVMEVEGGGQNRDRWGDIYANVPVKRMVALYDYDPQELSPNVDAEQVELSFTTGQIINVYGEMDDDGFYMAEIEGVRGLVPSNFLTEAPDQYGGSGQTSQQMPGAGRGQRGRGHGPGARGPPPPPRENPARSLKRDACPVLPSQLDNATNTATPNTQVFTEHQGRGRGEMIGAARGGNIAQGTSQQPTNYAQQTISTNPTSVFGQPTPFSGQAVSQQQFGGVTRLQQHKGVPQVIPTIGAPLQQQQPQQQQQQQQGPNLMQKLNEITAPGGDILSKGKELIFMKFGLGGK